MNKLNHVAIIMDGNGRWGLKKKRSRNYGHAQGLKTVETIIKASIESKILFLNEIFLESLMPFVFISLFKITAAAKTGPAKQPLPTSSTPAIFFTLSNVNFIFKI